MSVPELKQKKIAREAALAKAAQAAAEQETKDNAALEKSIFAKAEKYEQEYAAVSIQLFLKLTLVGCILVAA